MNADAPRWYAEWAERHRTACSLPREWLAAAAAWWPIFRTLRATADDLGAATRAVMVAGLPFERQHLPAVKSALGAIRDQRAAESARAAWDRPACELCGGGGVVVVPHPKWVRGGAWVSYGSNAAGDPMRHCAGVRCLCLGPGDGPNVADYERAVCPFWRRLMDEADAESALLRKVHSPADYPADPAARWPKLMELFADTAF